MRRDRINHKTSKVPELFLQLTYVSMVTKVSAPPSTSLLIVNRTIFISMAKIHSRVSEAVVLLIIFALRYSSRGS